MTQLPTSYYGICFFILGALLGSFANVVIYRLPQSKSVVHPGSSCPECGHKVRWFDNIPMISWLILRGKCRDCQTAISWRYPLVEFLTGLLFLMIFLKVGFQWVLIEYLYLAFALVVVSFIDFDHMILPDVFTLSGIVLGLVGSLVNPERQFLPSILGVLVGGGFLWAVAYFYWVFRKQEGMGGGDIKLLAWLGAVLTWNSIPFIILVSSLLGGVVGGLLALKSKKGFRTIIPFGPYISLAAILYILYGQQWIQWYLSFISPY